MPDNCKPAVSVCLSPALLDNFDLAEQIVVVIDVLRATTTICAALDSGVDHIVPVTTLEECAAWAEQGYVCAAERDGRTAPGFAYGNSPEAYMRPEARGIKLAFTTTNGTKALHAAEGAFARVVGAFANLTALADWLRPQGRPVLCLCAGWKDEVCLEDTLFAGALTAALEPDYRLGDDAAMLARAWYETAPTQKKRFIVAAGHYRRLAAHGLQTDAKYCLRSDTHPVVPIYREGRIVRA